MKSFISRFNQQSQKGFGILETVIAMGLLGIGAIMFLKMQENMSRGYATSERKMGELELKRQIAGILADSDACKATFGGTTIGAAVTDIKNPDGVVLFSTGKTYEHNSLKIVSMVTQDRGDWGANKTRMVNFIISLEKTKTQSYSRPRNMIIPLNVAVVDPAAPITGCYSNMDLMIDAAIKETCLAFDAVWDPTNKKCHFENLSVHSDTVQKLNVTADGNVGIGMAAGATKLDVAGEVKIGNTGIACTATTVGALRYFNNKMEFCDGTDWAPMGGGGYSDVVTVTSNPTGCPSTMATATCPTNYRVISGGHIFVATCGGGCDEKDRFLSNSKPMGDNQWQAKLECSKVRAFAVCGKK